MNKSGSVLLKTKLFTGLNLPITSVKAVIVEAPINKPEKNFFSEFRQRNESQAGDEESLAKPHKGLNSTQRVPQLHRGAGGGATATASVGDERRNGRRPDDVKNRQIRNVAGWYRKRKQRCRHQCQGSTT